MIQLTTPYEPGDTDTVSTYTHVGVTFFKERPLAKWAKIEVCYGVESAGVLVPGAKKALRFTVANEPDADPAHTNYDDLATLLATKGTEDACCQWLKDKLKFAGTVL